VRFRFALALMVAGMLFAAGIASAQTTTTTGNTNTLSGYTNTTPTSGYTTTTPTTTVQTETQAAETQAAAPTTTSGTQAKPESSVAPAVAAQPAGSAPSSLAFTGGEPLLFILAGLVIAGGAATLLVRDRRRSQD